MKFFLLILFVISVIDVSSQNYYWAGEDKIEITKTNKKSVQLKKSYQINAAQNSILDKHKLVNYKNNVFTFEDSSIISTLNKESIFKVSDIYETKGGRELIIFNEIICKGDSNKIENLLKGLNFDIIKKKNNLRFLLRINDKSINIIKLANQLYESGFFEYCYPNFISEVNFNRNTGQHYSNKLNKRNKNSFILNSFPNDPYFNKQFYLHNTGQLINDGHYGTVGADIKALSAWGITKGSSNVVVAVIDEGVTSNHPDLPNTRQVRLNGSNFSGIGSVNNPSATNDGNHGNACAGIIAAEQNNGQGITGVCPECKIMPIKIFGSSSNNDIADAIEFAYNNGANIISNSWGYNTSDKNFFPAIVDEIINAINQNTLVVFAAGNTANQIVGDEGFVMFPANNSNIDGLICVGASNRDDLQANYSPTNDYIEVVAPSHNAYPDQILGETFEVWTIDIPYNDGYNPCNFDCDYPRFLGEELPSSGINYQSYTGRMGGTSASCPQVAGVAALLLSLKPELTPNEIENIIKESSDKIGGYSYIDGKSDETGFGRINAYKALLLNDCPLDIVISNVVLLGQSDYRFAQNTITANNTIKNGGEAYFSPGITVSLKPGFKAESGSTFRAYIQGCSAISNKTGKKSSKISTKNVEEELKNNFTIYPNPSTGIFYLSTNNIISNYKVINQIGKTILENKTSNNNFKVSLQKYPSGVYFIQLQFENGEIETRKIIKK
jgi:subtilisin family serine protease